MTGLKCNKRTEGTQNRKNIAEFFTDMIFILAGCILGSFATVSILIPSGLTSGGVIGIARIMQSYFNVNFSIIYYIGSFTILILATIFLGIKEGRNIILLTILYPAMIAFWEKLDISLLEQSDDLLAAIYCGIFFGICNGLVLMRGYSFGGTDTIAKIIKKRLLPYVDVSRIILAVDGVIIILSGFIYGRNVALYALITSIILSKTMEGVMFGFEKKIVKMEIISCCHKEITDYIITEIDRGVTVDSAVGAYTGNERKRLVVFCSPRESILIRQFTARLDKTALVAIIHVDSIWGVGTGFKAIEKEENI